MNKKNGSFFVLVLLIYWIGLFPGIKGANDLPYSSIAYLKNLLAFPNAWSSLSGSFGQNQLATLWSWPSNLLYALGATLGFSFGILVVFFGILPILIIGFYSMRKYSSLFLKLDIASYFTSFFFLVNSYILLIVDGGQLLWGLAYSIFPYCLYRIEKKIQSKNYDLSFLDFAGIIFLSFCDLRAVYLLGIWILLRLLCYLVFEKTDKSLFLIRQMIVYGILTIGLLFLLHSYWLIPLLLSGSNIVPDNLIVSKNVDFLHFLSLGQALLLQQPHWYKNHFGEIALLNPFFLLIPLLAFFPLTFKDKSKSIGFLFLIALIGIFLAKGLNPPFGGIFEYLFSQVQGFFLFRDSSKFLVFVSVSYSVLIGLSIQKFLIWKARIKQIKIGTITTGAVIVYLLLLYSPVFTNRMGGLLGFAPDYAKYHVLQEVIPDLLDGKILWIPSKPSLAYVDPKHMSLNATDLISLRPFATGTRGTYETLNFLREASYSGELLKIAGIRYLGYAPLNPRWKYKEDQIVYHQVFLDQLENRRWIVGKENHEQVPILKLEKAKKMFFIPKNSYLVIGSDSVYQESTKSAQASLSNQGFVFAEETNIVKQLIKKTKLPILLNQTTETDLILDLYADERLYFPAQKMSDSPDRSGWWKRRGGDFLLFKDFLINKYGINNQDFDLGGGWAIAEGSRELVVPIKVKKGDSIFIRALESTRSGVLKIDNMSEINLQYPRDQIRWLLAGTVDEDAESLLFTTSGDITIINAVKAVSKADLSRAAEDIRQKQIVSNLELNSTDDPEVEFVRHNDSKYSVKVKGIQRPSLLVFTQSYDPKWEMNGKPSIPVYSIFNGFEVSVDGKYLVEYSPHQYMKYGLWISLTTLLGLSGLILWKKFT